MQQLRSRNHLASAGVQRGVRVIEKAGARVKARLRAEALVDALRCVGAGFRAWDTGYEGSSLYCLARSRGACGAEDRAYNTW